MGRPLVVAWQEDAETLGALYRSERDYQLRPRVQALWLVRQGRSVRETAGIVGTHERTVQQWLAWYRQAGLAGLRAHRRQGPGKAAWLSPEQQAALVAAAATGSFYTAQDAVAWVQQSFGVTYRLKGMYRLLDRLKVRPKVPRPFNPKRAPEAQAAWKGGAYAPRSRRPG
jgi:transposase